MTSSEKKKKIQIRYSAAPIPPRLLLLPPSRLRGSYPRCSGLGTRSANDCSCCEPSPPRHPGRGTQPSQVPAPFCLPGSPQRLGRPPAPPQAGTSPTADASQALATGSPVRLKIVEVGVKLGGLCCGLLKPLGLLSWCHVDLHGHSRR